MLLTSMPTRCIAFLKAWSRSATPVTCEQQQQQTADPPQMCAVRFTRRACARIVLLMLDTSAGCWRRWHALQGDSQHGL